jgi:hypothetical protein
LRRVLRDGRVVHDRKRRRVRFVQDANLAGHDLHFPGRQLRIGALGGAPLHPAEHRDDELATDPLRRLEQRLVVARHDLRDAISIADVVEEQRSQIANGLDPAEKDHLLADVGRTQRAAGVRATKITERMHDDVCGSDSGLTAQGWTRDRSSPGSLRAARPSR